MKYEILMASCEVLISRFVDVSNSVVIFDNPIVDTGTIVERTGVDSFYKDDKLLKAKIELATSNTTKIIRSCIIFRYMKEDLFFV